MKTNIRALSILLLAIPCLASSGPCNLDLNSACRGSPAAAVIVTITNAQGTGLATATVSYKLNGGGPYLASCNGDCSSVALGYDVAGRFEITVTAPGYLSASRTVDAQLDSLNCHSVTQYVTIALAADGTVGALSGAWTTTTYYGSTTIRFGDHGEAIGAILYGQGAAGDHNFYYAFNSHPIRGVAGQQIYTATVTDPTRTGNIFYFRANLMSIPIGFENATMSPDFLMLNGMLQGVPASYARLSEIPPALLDP